MNKNLAIWLCAFLISCATKQGSQKDKAEQVSIYMITDITDAPSLRLWPKPTPTLELFNCNEFPERACKFDLSVITDLQTNPTYQAYLPTAEESEKNNKNDDLQYRKRTIKGFYKDVNHQLQRFYQENDTTIDRQYSEVWATIARSLEKLAKEPSGIKYLLIFSDLQELSEAGSAYQSLQKLDAKKIREKLEASHPVPENIANIKIAIVYQPTDRKDDLRFNKLFQAYKLMLEEKGAVVTGQSTNEHF